MGNLLSLNGSSHPCPARRAADPGRGLVVAGSLFLVPALTSSSLLILAGQGWLLWLPGVLASAGSGGRCPLSVTVPGTGRSTPSLRECHEYEKVDLAKITLGLLFLSLLIISCFMVQALPARPGVVDHDHHRHLAPDADGPAPAVGGKRTLSGVVAG